VGHHKANQADRDEKKRQRHTQGASTDLSTGWSNLEENLLKAADAVSRGKMPPQLAQKLPAKPAWLKAADAVSRGKMPPQLAEKLPAKPSWMPKGMGQLEEEYQKNKKRQHHADRHEAIRDDGVSESQASRDFEKVQQDLQKSFGKKDIQQIEQQFLKAGRRNRQMMQQEANKQATLMKKERLQQEALLKGAHHPHHVGPNMGFDKHGNPVDKHGNRKDQKHSLAETDEKKTFQKGAQHSLVETEQEQAATTQEEPSLVQTEQTADKPGIEGRHFVEPSGKSSRIDIDKKYRDDWTNEKKLWKMQGGRHEKHLNKDSLESMFGVENASQLPEGHCRCPREE